MGMYRPRRLSIVLRRLPVAVIAAVAWLAAGGTAQAQGDSARTAKDDKPAWQSLGSRYFGTGDRSTIDLKDLDGTGKKAADGVSAATPGATLWTRPYKRPGVGKRGGRKSKKPARRDWQTPRVDGYGEAWRKSKKASQDSRNIREWKRKKREKKASGNRGPGLNLAGGWLRIGNLYYGQGKNTGGGWQRFGNILYGTGDNAGRTCRVIGKKAHCD